MINKIKLFREKRGEPPACLKQQNQRAEKQIACQV